MRVEAWFSTEELHEDTISRTAHLRRLVSLAEPRATGRDDPVDAIIPARFCPFLHLEPDRFRIILDDSVGAYDVCRVLVDEGS